jgi:hypothetical protein
VGGLCDLCPSWRHENSQKESVYLSEPSSSMRNVPLVVPVPKDDKGR